MILLLSTYTTSGSFHTPTLVSINAYRHVFDGSQIFGDFTHNCIFCGTNMAVPNSLSTPSQQITMCHQCYKYTLLPEIEQQIKADLIIYRALSQHLVADIVCQILLYFADSIN